MTSMPASRSARAMIFAPRSCPSRPGLATTTRILRAVAALTGGADATSAPPAGSVAGCYLTLTFIIPGWIAQMIL